MAEEDTTHRKTSLGQAATGGALFGVGAGLKTGLDARLRRTRSDNPVKAAFHSATPKRSKRKGLGTWKHGVHGPDLAGRVGARSLQAVGLPLAAYGVVNAVRPKPDKVAPVPRKELARNVARTAVYLPAVDAGRKQLEVAKAMNLSLPRAASRPLATGTKGRLVGYKKPNTRIQRMLDEDRAQRWKVAKSLSAREKRSLDTHRQVGRTASQVGGTLGLAALALRSPAAAKTLTNRGVRSKRLTALAGREASATRHSNTLGIAAIGTGSAGSFNYAAQQKLERKQSVVKRDDRFLRGYKERISPDAERGYKTLKRGRNEQVAQAGGAATMTGLGSWLTGHEAKHAPKMLKSPAVLIAGASTVASGINAAHNLAGAKRYHDKMGKIKAKGRSRRAQGLYGPGRGLTPVDSTSARARNLAKAMGGI